MAFASLSRRSPLPVKILSACALIAVPVAGCATGTPLDGSGGRETLRWIVHAGSRRNLTVRVTSALAGRAETRIDLKGGR